MLTKKDLYNEIYFFSIHGKEELDNTELNSVINNVNYKLYINFIIRNGKEYFEFFISFEDYHFNWNFFVKEHEFSNIIKKNNKSTTKINFNNDELKNEYKTLYNIILKQNNKTKPYV